MVLFFPNTLTNIDKIISNIIDLPNNNVQFQGDIYKNGPLKFFIDNTLVQTLDSTGVTISVPKNITDDFKVTGNIVMSTELGGGKGRLFFTDTVNNLNNYITYEPSNKIKIQVGDLNINSTNTTIAGNLTLPNNSITTSFINNGAVDNSKLANDAVQTSNILNGAVDNSKLGDGSVDGSKLNATLDLSGKTISNITLPNNSITAAMLNNNIVDGSKLSDTLNLDGKTIQNITLPTLNQTLNVNAELNNINIKFNKFLDTTTITGITGTFKYTVSVLVNNRFVYCIPNTATNFLVIDTLSNTTTSIPITGITGSYHGAVLVGDKIYCIPFTATNVLVIDTTNNTTSTPITGVGGGTKWRGGVLVGDKIYCIPHDAQNVLVIDTTNNATSIISLGQVRNSSNGVLVGDKIYCMPWNSTNILVIDTFNNTVSTPITGITGFNKFWNGVLVGDKIYCIPAQSTGVLVIDTTDNTTSTPAGLSGLPGGFSWVGGVLYDNRYIYCTPNASTSVLIIDTQNDTYRLENGLSSDGDKWVGPGVIINNKIYNAPSNATEVLIINILAGSIQMDKYVKFTNDSNDELMRITSNGNVGINETNPIEKLDVNGTIRTKGLRVTEGELHFFTIPDPTAITIEPKGCLSFRIENNNKTIVLKSSLIKKDNYLTSIYNPSSTSDRDIVFTYDGDGEFTYVITNNKNGGLTTNTGVNSNNYTLKKFQMFQFLIYKVGTTIYIHSSE